jgi:hypothetical protein
MRVTLGSVSVFEVADERGTFLEYLAYLHAQGVRPTRDAWLEEAASRLMWPGGNDTEPPTYLDAEWTLERRRLLVVLTWPQAGGGRALKFRFPAEPDLRGEAISGVFGRSYEELWSNVLWEPARLGLVQTQDGRVVSPETVDGLMADPLDRPSKVREGFVLAWWDIVAVAECAGHSYEPLDELDSVGGRARMQDGHFAWNRSELMNRIGAASIARRSRDEVLRAAEAAANALKNPELNPLELHRRITANGRIEPPSVGSKYRALFEHLDSVQFAGVHGSIKVSASQLDELLCQPKSDAPRLVRGARGVPGLPAAARTTEQWWYGPWNPNLADQDVNWTVVEGESWSVAIGKKSHTRAWMAAGLRARPVIRQGTLVEVEFAPVIDHGYWWPWRTSLRDGSFREVILG